MQKGDQTTYDPRKPLETIGNYSIHVHTGKNKHACYVVAHKTARGMNEIFERVADVSEKDYESALFAMRKLKEGDDVWEWAISNFGRGVDGKWDRGKAFKSWCY